MSQPIDLRISQEATSEGTRRSLYLDKLSDPQRRSLTAYFDLAGEYAAPPPSALDGFVFAVLFYAMRLGQDIRVHGAMSLDALRQIDLFQEAWLLWRPELYKRIRILPDDLTDPGFGNRNQALAAFSGGVDSIFTVLRHATDGFGISRYPLNKTVLMVHGFDIALRRPEQLDALQRRTAPLLDKLGLEVRTIRTNLKELGLQMWEDSFMAQLVCCLQNYSHEFGYALVGSSEPYNALVLPWGSNPATDYLLSGSGMTIVHDGAGYSRTDKVETIATDPIATAAVKVCWEGTDTYTNCGECEKCVRTLMNFLAVGVRNPACFDRPLNLRQIRGIILRNDGTAADARSIVHYCRKHGINQGWVNDLEKVVARYRGRPSALRRFAPHVRNVWAMAQRGDWHRIRQKIKQKMKRSA